MRKAGIASAAITILALGAFAASGLGAGAFGLAQVSRPSATSANVQFAGGVTKAGVAREKVLYGSAKVALPLGDSTVTLGKCPRKSHVINGSVAALHGQQAKYLTIRGFGVASPKSWFVDVNNGSETLNPPGFEVNAVGFIVCEKS